MTLSIYVRNSYTDFELNLIRSHRETLHNFHFDFSFMAVTLKYQNWHESAKINGEYQHANPQKISLWEKANIKICYAWRENASNYLMPDMKTHQIISLIDWLID